MAMVVNEPVRHVKFISYTGEYPNLCNGVLVLDIDGKVVTFGCSDDCDYPRFWISGGFKIKKAPWIIDCHTMPKEYIKYAYEIDKAFNENVPQGCCGGCIGSQ